MSLGKPRASPPRIRSRTGGTRSISMGYAAQHFGRRQFFGKTGHRLRCFEPPMSRTETGRSVFPTHSPHHALQVARICCRCRKEKCCNTLCSCSTFGHSADGQTGASNRYGSVSSCSTRSTYSRPLSSRAINVRARLGCDAIRIRTSEKSCDIPNAVV